MLFYEALVKAGVKADIDLQTGEVMLDFGDAYFETDSAKLNADMKSILEKAMPVYAKSLFGNDKVKDKISAVEIVGFASPTYGGKFVDPKSSAKKVFLFSMAKSVTNEAFSIGRVLCTIQISPTVI